MIKSSTSALLLVLAWVITPACLATPPAAERSASPETREAIRHKPLAEPNCRDIDEKSLKAGKS